MLQMHMAMQFLPNPIDRTINGSGGGRNHGSFLFQTAYKRS